ncbi:MAG: hypothetical protein JWL81_1552, partial [Verrucomicrobiales bacterium]|nr:hypothetical protein [Verrucomicrobiales bacterium]
WDRFVLPPGTTSSFQVRHAPNVLGFGDDEGNASNYNEDAALYQVLTPQAFVTSSGAIYSFAAATGFEMRYTHTGSQPVAGVVWQVKTAGSIPLDSSVALRYTPSGGGAPVLLPARYHALDDPGTAGFSDQTMRGYEWDLTGLNIADYTLVFRSESSSMALYEAQLDTTTGATFNRSLGWLLTTRALPTLRSGSAGLILRDLPAGTEKRFFIGGSEVPLTPQPADGFALAGWRGADDTVLDSQDPLTVSFDTQSPRDLTVAALFSPITWSAFRTHFFNHANSLTGTADDYLNNAISGPSADPDADGFNNLAEYVFGGDPMSPDRARLTPTPSIVVIAGQSHPALTYRRQGVAGDAMTTIEVSHDLVHWSSAQDGNALTVETEGPLEADGTRLITARTIAPQSAQPTFLRLHLSLPPAP